MKTMLGKKNFGIVGFSYEVTNQTSTKPRIVKRELGRKSSWKIDLARGYNYSSEYPWNLWENWWGYGYSCAYIDNKGPFYSIVGGYTERTGIDWKRVPKNDSFKKDEEWGVETGDKFCLWEGHSWNQFLNQEGYSYSYVYLMHKEGINNFLGSRIQSTSKDRSCPRVEINFFGESSNKEFYWGGSYGWSEQHQEGYNNFSLYVDEELKLDDKGAFWGKINEIEWEREEEKKQSERIKSQNEILKSALDNSLEFSISEKEGQWKSLLTNIESQISNETNKEIIQDLKNDYQLGDNMLKFLKKEIDEEVMEKLQTIQEELKELKNQQREVQIEIPAKK